jgi:hypothetical protein
MVYGYGFFLGLTLMGWFLRKQTGFFLMSGATGLLLLTTIFAVDFYRGVVC